MSVPGHSHGDTVGISGMGYYIPDGILTSHEMARRSGIPEAVFLEKIGIERKHIAGPDLHPAEMGVRAANNAIEDAGIDPRETRHSWYIAVSATTITGSGRLLQKYRIKPGQKMRMRLRSGTAAMVETLVCIPQRAARLAILRKSMPLWYAARSSP